MSRYETYIGDPAIHAPGLNFIDGTGMRIIDGYLANGNAMTVKGYIKLFFRYPIEFLSIYGKHLYNSFFPIYPEQYITRLDADKYVLTVIGLTIIFLFFLLLLYAQGRMKFDMRVGCILAAAFPSIVILLGAVEQRFVVLLYLIIYVFVCNAKYKEIIGSIGVKQGLKILACYFLFLITALAVEGEILNSLTAYPIIFRGR